MSTNMPVVVWQRADFRIVAVDDVDDKGESIAMLLMERRCRDIMGQDSWRLVCFHHDGDDEIGFASNVLMLEIASHVDVLPTWVKKFVREDLDVVDDCAIDDDGVA